MNKDTIKLLSFLQSSLFEAPFSQSELFDWSALLQEAQDQAVVGLVTPVVKKYADEHEVPNLGHWIVNGKPSVPTHAAFRIGKWYGV